MFDLSQFKRIILEIIPDDIKQLRQYLDGKSDKGKNGTWGDKITLATDLYQPQRLTYYEPSSRNKPFNSSYGTVVSVASQGEFVKRGQNWIASLAFSTDQRIFFTQSINAGQDNWVAVPTASFSYHSQKIASIFPSVGQSVTIPFSLNNRNLAVDVSVRVDLVNNSLLLKDTVEVIVENNRVTGLKITNNTNNSATNNRPMTVYVRHER